jgi:D-glycero-D-manno-heptose 1,7-bisphosphate phosphatase
MKLVILDRDGVINYDSEAYIKSPDEWHPIPGSLEAIARLNQAGYRIAVATNQSGVGRGYYDLAMLARIHQKMNDALTEVGGKIEAIFFCPHTPEMACECRKPKPGLLFQIAKYFQIELKGIPAVGDSLRDIQAARAVAARPILVKTGNKDAFLEKVEIYPDLASVADSLIKSETA